MLQQQRQKTIQLGNNKKLVQKGIFYENSSILKQGIKKVINNDNHQVEQLYQGQFYKQNNQLKGDKLVAKLKNGRFFMDGKIKFQGQFRQNGSYRQGILYTYLPINKGINTFEGTFHPDHTYDVGVASTNGIKFKEGEFYPNSNRLKRGILYDKNGLKIKEGIFSENGELLKNIQVTR